MLEVKVTNYLERYGIEVKINSVQNDGSQRQPWIFYSKGMNKHVTELPEENQTPIHYEEMAFGAEKPVARKRQEQIIPSSSSSSTTIMPINQRKWNDILALGHFDEESCKISKKMPRLLFL